MCIPDAFYSEKSAILDISKNQHFYVYLKVSIFYGVCKNDLVFGPLKIGFLGISSGTPFFGGRLGPHFWDPIFGTPFGPWWIDLVFGPQISPFIPYLVLSIFGSIFYPILDIFLYTPQF